MSNIISLSSTAPKEEWLTMSNQGTDCFMELLIKSASEITMTRNQKGLINLDSGLIQLVSFNQVFSRDSVVFYDCFVYNICRRISSYFFAMKGGNDYAYQQKRINKRNA